MIEITARSDLVLVFERDGFVYAVMRPLGYG